MSQYDPYQPPEEAPNPYAPPEADLTAAPHHMPTLGEGRFSIGEAIGKAWELTSSRSWLVVGIGIVLMAFIILWAIFRYVVSELLGPDTPQGVLVDFALACLGGVIQIWLAAGQTFAYIKLISGGSARFGDLFNGGRWLVRLVLASLLYYLIIIGLAVALFIPGAVLAWAMGPSSPSIPVVVILATIPVMLVAELILVARLGWFSYAIIEREAGVIESLQFSTQISRGRTLELIGLLIVTGFISISGALACGIGLLVTVPLAAMIYNCTYTGLVGGLIQPVKLEPLGEPDFI
ncbi:MAG: hypothetical protein U0835_04650 [Isosphaeraceae bacterium]